MSDLRTGLLGLPAITALNLAMRIDSMETSKGRRSWKNFQTYSLVWGTSKVNMKSKLKDNAKTHSVSAPRSVPGVITKVDEATPWCAGMAVLIWMCVDLQALNKSILRELHSLTSDDALIVSLRHFIARHDKPTLLWSNHNTNFVDAHTSWKVPQATEVSRRHLTIFFLAKHPMEALVVLGRLPSKVPRHIDNKSLAMSNSLS